MAKFDDTRSYYRATAHGAPSRPALAGDAKADVAVLGAGFTGLSAALELAEAGYSVIVLDAERVGYGGSGRNGGQICTGYIKAISELGRYVGDQNVRAAWDIADAAPKLIKQRVAKYGIDCDLKWGYLHCAERKSQLEELREMQAQWEGVGYTGSQIVEQSAMGARIGSELYLGALWEPGAGHMHPLNYCLGLAKAAEAAGVRICENSRVTKIDSGDNPALFTDQGIVRAGHLVLAGNAYLKETHPFLYRRLMPVGSYIIGTEPLGDTVVEELIPGDSAVANCNFIIDYFRRSGDNRLLFGGRATYSGLEPTDLGGFVKPRMLRVFPQLKDAKIDYVWGGQIGITVDRMPHLGRIGKRSYFAQGFSGHGVALSNMCGKLLADAIRGQSERYDILANVRHPIFPGGRFRTPLLTLGMLWYRLKDALA